MARSVGAPNQSSRTHSYHRGSVKMARNHGEEADRCIQVRSDSGARGESRSLLQASKALAWMDRLEKNSADLHSPRQCGKEAR